MVPTNKLKNLCEEANMDYESFAIANLVAGGLSEKDAYYLVCGRESSAPDAYEMGKLRKIISDSSFQLYVEKKRKVIEKTVKKKFEDKQANDETFSGGLLSKDDVATELLRIAKELPRSSKERADILMKYSDLLQMKKDEVKDEEKLVHFYLPVSCYNCPLYEEARMSKRDLSDINI